MMHSTHQYTLLVITDTHSITMHVTYMYITCYTYYVNITYHSTLSVTLHHTLFHCVLSLHNTRPVLVHTKTNAVVKIHVHTPKPEEKKTKNNV